MELQACSSHSIFQWTGQNRASGNMPVKHVTLCQWCFEAYSTGWWDCQIKTRNKACKNLSTVIIPLLCNMAQNKVINDDIVSILDCVDENISEVECGDSDDEIGDNQESDHKVTSDSEQCGGKVVA
jgi:hypothetical protein